MKNNISSLEKSQLGLKGTHPPHHVNPTKCSTTSNLNEASHQRLFNWGDSSIGLRRRANSITNLACINDDTNDIRSSSPSNRFRCNRTKIDPRVYVDVQSNGLVSRIVRYHENQQCLHRSSSTNSLYNKKSQYPLVHSNKVDLPYRATKQNVTITRIPQPEKSIFNGTTLSSILHSSSVLSLRKDNDMSRDNRPILHPPPTESELTPTRSVLEVLKEISRKRINSDDLSDGDNVKKYRNRTMMLDATDNSSPNVNANNKRMREQFNATHEKLPAPSTTPKTTKQCSPEQSLTKRLCTYNNDITSSLSSSQIHTKKRKLYEQKRSSEKTSPPLSKDDVEQQTRKKLQREQLVGTLQPVAKDSCILPLFNGNSTNVFTREQREGSEKDARLVDVPVDVNVAVTPTPLSAPASTKKLTLFNKRYDEKPETAVTPSLNRRSLDLGDASSIPFVKPRKNSSVAGTRNALIERTQKSKLALMLSGLRGELYSEEDQVHDGRRLMDTVAAATEMPDGVVVQRTSSSDIIGVGMTPIMPMAGRVATVATTTATSSTGTGLGLASSNITSASSNNTIAEVKTSAIATSNQTSPLSARLGGFQYPLPEEKLQPTTPFNKVPSPTSAASQLPKDASTIMNAFTSQTSPPPVSTMKTTENTFNEASPPLTVTGETVAGTSNSTGTGTALGGGYTFDFKSSTSSAQQQTAMTPNPGNNNTSPPTAHTLFNFEAKKPLESKDTLSFAGADAVSANTTTTPVVAPHDGSGDGSGSSSMSTTMPQNATTSSSFLFSGAATTSNPSSSSSATTVPIANMFTVPSSTPAPALVAAAPPKTMTTPFMLTTTTTVPSSSTPFTFGGATNSNAPSSGLPTAAATATASASAASTNLFTFGGQNVANKAFVFDVAKQPNNNNQNTAASSNTISSPSFNFSSSLAKQPQAGVEFSADLGSTTAAATIVENNKAANFSFGGTATPALAQTSTPTATPTPTPTPTPAPLLDQSKVNIFGSSSIGGIGGFGAFGSAEKPNFSFGGAPTGGLGTIFNAPSTANGGGNSFASLAAASATTAPNNKAFVFGAESGSSSGGPAMAASTKPTPQAPPMFTFTGDSSAKTTAITSSSFNFAPSNVNITTADRGKVGAATAPPPPSPFTFGSGGGGGGGGGGLENKPLNAMSPMASPANIFTLPGSGGSAVPSAFKFTAGQSLNSNAGGQAASPAPSPSPSLLVNNANLFAPPQGVATSKLSDRPIRKATRRLQKS